MASERTSVYAMVNQVLAESRENLASSGLDKTASAAETAKESNASAESHKVASYNVGELTKIADACDHLAENIHLVNDERSPQEKLAEYSAIHEALRKQAGDVDPNSAHQSTEANSESQSPKTVSTDDSGTGVGSGNAIPSEETNTPGTSLQPGESGQAMGAHQSPGSVSPTESNYSTDGGNALETNKAMLQSDQPDDLLKQPGGEQSTGSAPADISKAAAASPTYQRIVAKASQAGVEKLAEQARLVKTATVMLHKAVNSGIPGPVAIELIRQKCGDDMAKIAEDALNPASISGGTEPVLQSSAGTPSPLSQGSEAGENTPRQSAPTGGEASGRELVASNEAAMNATKGQAKTQNTRAGLSELLAEPALSSGSDKTLEKSLDNTSSAGVKISSAQANAARELLKRFSDSSPENRQKVAALAKLAMDPDMAAGGGAPPMGGGMTEPPPDELAAEEAAVPAEEEAPPPEMGEEAVSDEALEAASAGVTPEEVAAAEQILAMQGEAAAAAPEEEEMASSPEAGGGEEMEVQGMGNAGMSSPPPAPMT